ncbi:unnamed protein product [Pieris brassicae]|uniref:Uncharacterized protein n=1 Tax=Pieris brassicae TaxID=7116 RepID=A0A9P0TX16_PIEBR|nr:unnamed protein product [Pieris brassicae]
MSYSPYYSECAISYGPIGLHIGRNGRCLIVGRRCRQDGALGRTLGTALHQRHGDTHGDARVPRGAAYCRHPTTPRLVVTADSSTLHVNLNSNTAPITKLFPVDTRRCYRLLLYYSCSNDYAGITD